jgi:hypothetical protein
MLFTLGPASRPRTFINIIRPACQSKYFFPIATQFHTAATTCQEEDYARKGSVQYKLRGKVKKEKFEHFTIILC